MLVALLVAGAVASAAPAVREADLQISVVGAADGGVEGRSTRATVRLAPNPKRLPAVGVLTASATGAGEQWLTTIWQAALVATGVTQTSLLDYEVTLRVSEPVDGPSAGMSTAAALTALIRGKKLSPNTAIIGAINPDGSIGPVPEPLPRLRAAARDGIKRFGFPIGGRLSAGPKDVPIDLIAEAEKLGVEAKELAGLDDAYRFLTGEALPRIAPAIESDMELWPIELAAINGLTAKVRGEIEATRPKLDTLLDEGPADEAATLKARFQRLAQKATDFERSGDSVRALVVTTATLTLMRATLLDADVTRLVGAGDAAAALALLKAQRTAYWEERRALLRDLRERFPNSTRVNDLYAMDVLESIVTQALALRVDADGAALEALDPTSQAFAEKAQAHAEALLGGREELENGRRFFGLYSALPALKKAFPPFNAERLAASYVSAGAAWRASLQPHLASWPESDPTVLELGAASVLLETETDPRARLVLAGRQSIYSAHLVNLTSALGARVDENGVFTLRNQRLLTAQLDQARAGVLQSCGRSKRALGFIPLAARTRYLNARAAREGTDQQKAESIAELWLASWLCELAVRTER